MCTSTIDRKIATKSTKLLQKSIASLLTENDLKLLALMFTTHPTQANLDNFLKTYDIEVAGSYKALMLSYFMKMYPELSFTDYETPRLKGLLEYYKFRNLKLFASFTKIGKILAHHNIPMLMLKGSAMKCLRPELSRAMEDIDILIPERAFIQAIHLIRKMGYRLDIFIHSIDVHEPDSDAGLLDIHRHINIHYKRARKSSWQ